MGKFSFKGLKKLIQLGDAAIDAVENIGEEFKGKSPSEIANILKDNVKGLNNPEIVKELKRTFFGRSPDEIKDILSQYKDLSVKDAADIAGAISKEEGLSDYLTEKLQNEAKAQKEKKKEAILKDLEAKKEARRTGVKPEAPAVKKEGGSSFGKKLSMAKKITNIFGKGSQKEEKPKPKAQNKENKKPGNKPK